MKIEKFLSKSLVDINFYNLRDHVHGFIVDNTDVYDFLTFYDAGITTDDEIEKAIKNRVTYVLIDVNSNLEQDYSQRIKLIGKSTINIWPFLYKFCSENYYGVELKTDDYGKFTKLNEKTLMRFLKMTTDNENVKSWPTSLLVCVDDLRNQIWPGPKDVDFFDYYVLYFNKVK